MLHCYFISRTILPDSEQVMGLAEQIVWYIFKNLNSKLCCYDHIFTLSIYSAYFIIKIFFSLIWASLKSPSNQWKMFGLQFFYRVCAMVWPVYWVRHGLIPCFGACIFSISFLLNYWWNAILVQDACPCLFGVFKWSSQKLNCLSCKANGKPLELLFQFVGHFFNNENRSETLIKTFYY